MQPRVFDFLFIATSVLSGHFDMGGDPGYIILPKEEDVQRTTEGIVGLPPLHSSQGRTMYQVTPLADKVISDFVRVRSRSTERIYEASFKSNIELHYVTSLHRYLSYRIIGPLLRVFFRRRSHTLCQRLPQRTLSLSLSPSRHSVLKLVGTRYWGNLIDSRHLSRSRSGEKWTKSLHLETQ